MKAVEITILMFLCLAIAAGLVWYAEQSDKSFSSPSSEVASIKSATFNYTSTLDLQRKLNRDYPDLKLVEDGVYGAATQAAHEMALGDQYAKELMGVK